MNLEIKARESGSENLYTTSHPALGGSIQTHETQDGVFVWFAPTRMRPRIYLGRILEGRPAIESHKEVLKVLVKLPKPVLHGFYKKCADRGRANGHLQGLV